MLASLYLDETTTSHQIAPMERVSNPGPLDQLASWMAEASIVVQFRGSLNVIYTFKIQVDVLQQHLDHSIPFRDPQFDPLLLSAADIRQKLDILHEIRLSLNDLDTLIAQARQDFEEHASDLVHIFRSAINTIHQEIPRAWILVHGLESALGDSEQTSMVFRNLLDGLYVRLLSDAVSSGAGSLGHGEDSTGMDEMDTDD